MLSDTARELLTTTKESFQTIIEGLEDLDNLDRETLRMMTHLADNATKALRNVAVTGYD